MKAKFVDIPTPHILLYDVFDEETLPLIWKELDFIHPILVDGSNTAPAETDGHILKNNKGKFIYDVYANINYSTICKQVRNIAFNSNMQDFWKDNWIKEMYNTTNWDSTLISYYDNGSYYAPHVDTAVFTMLLWLWKEPKSFSGGDFSFTRTYHNIECQNNSGIIFLSSEKHGVSKVNLKTPDYGRYCISVFSGIGHP
ncbi:2OG-Fe(II) oxygenase [archaeon]|nr:2OG-Fe(II) oxygenase [archaeon]